MVKPSESTRACLLTSLSCKPGTVSGAKNTEHPMARSGQLHPGKLSLLFIPLQSATHLVPVLLLTFSDLGDTELCRTRTGGSIMHKQPRTQTTSALIEEPTGGFSLYSFCRTP